MSDCHDCPEHWFKAHLGRCRACLYKSISLTLILTLAVVGEYAAGWFWPQLYVVATVVMWVAAAVLTVAHLLAAAWYRWRPVAS